MHAEKPREIAARTLLGLRADADFIEKRLGEALSKVSLSRVDRAFCQQLVYGVVQHQSTLDWLIQRKTNGRNQRQILRVLLQLGLFQIFWLDRVPDHAVVHETVELSRRFGCGHQSGFVNAVLRGYLREEEETRTQLADLANTDPAIAHSHPRWLVSRWQTRWSPDECRSLLQWNNQPAVTYARLNTLKTTAAELMERWEHEGVEAVPVERDWLPRQLVWELTSHPGFDDMGTLRDGWFYIQDPSTLMACLALDIPPNRDMSVLDVCAAPGGKTTFLAQLMENRRRLVAQDNDSGRLERVRENCSRLGATHVEIAQPGREVPRESNARYDRILVDAPCSNTGVLRRRIELRWRLTEAELTRLTRLQLDLLNRSAGQLSPGGTLVYSTCSLEPEENSGVVEAFLADRPDFVLGYERTLLPFRDGVDGAFAAVLHRGSSKTVHRKKSYPV